MKGVLALLLTLLITLRLQYVAADCNSYQQSNTTFIPDCGQDDLAIKWPNYESPTSYYRCNGVGAQNSALMDCPKSQYFCFVLQACVSCAQYIPPRECESLPTEKTPNCVSSSNPTPTSAPGEVTTGTVTATTSGFPTPLYPDSTTPATTPTTTKTTTTKASTVSTASTASTVTTTTAAPGPTPPTQLPTDPNDIPPPPSPSPSTVDPGVPQPPTPAATPPVVEVEPPTVPPIPSA